MKVWWVLGYDRYYPGGDNFCESFLTQQEANDWIEETKKQDFHYDHYTIINISSRL